MGRIWLLECIGNQRSSSNLLLQELMWNLFKLFLTLSVAAATPLNQSYFFLIVSHGLQMSFGVC